MKLYLLERKGGGSYSELHSCVVRAPDMYTARVLADREEARLGMRRESTGDFLSDEKTTCEILPPYGAEEGVVCADFYEP
jgi:hypothetical protein